MEHEQLLSPVVKKHIFPIKTTTEMDAGVDQMMGVVPNREKKDKERRGVDREAPSPFNFLWQGHYNQCNLDRKQLKM
jgi:hypothetical protein